MLERARILDLDRHVRIFSTLPCPLDSVVNYWFNTGFVGGSVVKNLPANAGDPWDMGSIPGLGRSPEVGNGNSLQYSCLENSMGRGACGLQSLGYKGWTWLNMCARFNSGCPYSQKIGFYFKYFKIKWFKYLKWPTESSSEMNKQNVDYHTVF